jgi:hypothetical protein
MTASSSSSPLPDAQRGQRVRVTAFGPQPGDGETRVSTGGLGPGDEGTVLFTDSLGTVHVEWDSGGQFGLIPGQDAWETLTGDGPATSAAEDLAVHAQTLADDVTDCVTALPVDGEEEQDRLARMAARLAEDCAGLAAMARALPSRPRKQPGHTTAAVVAALTAAEAEHDFGGWLAGVLCQAAVRLGSSAAVVAGRDGSWEAGHVLALIRGTAGPDDEHLPAYRDGAAR